MGLIGGINDEGEGTDKKCFKDREEEEKGHWKIWIGIVNIRIFKRRRGLGNEKGKRRDSNHGEFRREKAGVRNSIRDVK